MTFEPGKSGNPEGRPKRPFKAALERALKRMQSGDDPAALEKLATKLVEKGLEGDLQSIKEVADRMDGKAAQVIVGDDEADAIRVEHSIPQSDKDIINRFIEQTREAK